MADIESAYNNSHRAFLQAFLARSVMTFEEAQPILAVILSARDENRPISAADITEADFQTYISVLNASLSPLDLEIRSTRPQTTLPSSSSDQDTHHEPAPLVWALVNTTSDALTQLATTHTPDEIAYVKRLLDAMFETYNTRRAEIMALTGMQALQLHKRAPARNRDSGVGGGDGDGETQGSAGASLTMAQAQKVLDDLVEEGWFDKSARGYLSLSPRALMELRGWLIETYNEPANPDESGDEGVERVKMCEACREIVTVFFRALPDRKCPVCKAEWTEQNFVGERAAKPQNRNRTSTATAASSGRMTMVDADDSE
ncbi:hypothetical protein MPH_02570 [Macrophomina phaseolina MS6]|uniref:Non-structural maintenance of chromosomes element 1 homolog n=1 Tax=Macrophomina phaseolina (strain MS6) TaxID=1126212 RepID=K2STS9_MACPH|nr:hypothetical protein MPH_02570 [Macrophomina phaseolina MS6]